MRTYHAKAIGLACAAIWANAAVASSTREIVQRSGPFGTGQNPGQPYENQPVTIYYDYWSNPGACEAEPLSARLHLGINQSWNVYLMELDGHTCTPNTDEWHFSYDVAGQSQGSVVEYVVQVFRGDTSQYFLRAGDNEAYNEWNSGFSQYGAYRNFEYIVQGPQPEPPTIEIDFPMQGEILVGPQYTARLSVNASTNNVRIRIDGGDWQQCRFDNVTGFWWYDWANYAAGPHTLVAETYNELGQRAETPPRSCTYFPEHVLVTPSPPIAGRDVTIQYYPLNRPLAGASQVYLHHGFNNWQSVVDPDPPMSQDDLLWEITVPLPANATQLDFVFRDGQANPVYDNNQGRDWHYAVRSAGDLNCDGGLDVGDVTPMALALADPAAYAASYGGCSAALADVTGDGVADGLDVAAFVQRLLSN